MKGPNAPQGLVGARVLVVEDEFFIADDMRSALTEAGAEVVGPVATCGEALDLVGSDGAITFAVLDINLGGESSFHVADVLLARGVPFVFATGYEANAVPDRFAAVRRWEKPFDLSAIVDTVAAVTAEGRTFGAGGPAARPDSHRGSGW